MITQRIKEYIDYKQLTVSSFESSIGASNGMLRRAFNAKTDIKSQWLENILEKYHDIDANWLLTGQGKMITKSDKNVVKKNDHKNDHKIEHKRNVPNNLPIEGEEMPIYKAEGEINYGPKGLYKGKSSELVPYYDVDFAAGGDIQTFEDGRITPAYYMDVPEFSGCTAFRAYSDSMEKLIKSGSILFGTKIEAWLEHLEYGQIYGIVCTDGRRYLKYIRKAKKHSSHFLLRSENKEYDDFDIPKKAIRNVWLVHGWLNKRT